MIDIKIKSECCGCYACTNICPKSCIDMIIDEEGFWYPKVDQDLCIGCSLCEKVCPVIRNSNTNDFDTLAYACKNKNENIRMMSSSGGIFTNLCEYVISNNGVVFGVAFDENFEVKHSEATNLSECAKFRGSKYVQSKIGDTYKSAKKYLDEGRFVLFTGTPCQIKGLNLYLRKKYDNLLAVDIVCHGVPSPKIFNMYVTDLMKKNNSGIESITFRDKSNGWQNYKYTINFKNGNKYNKLHKEDLYSRGFISDLFLRPSCNKCSAKNFTSTSDMTLGDYWGVRKIHPQFDDDKGVSLILVNSKKGQDILNKISDKIEQIKTDFNYSISCNTSIVNPAKYNMKREEFFKEVEERNEECLNELLKKYTHVNSYRKIIIKIRSILSKIKRHVQDKYIIK